MKHKIDLESLLKPISKDRPCGEDMRYTEVHEEIKEARRFDNVLDQGDWKRELKKSDWSKVITLSITALSKKTKDLQVAAWLTEALITTEGFGGLASGLTLTGRLLKEYWDSLYPPLDDGDLEYRIAPFTFMNEKYWSLIKQIPLTDFNKTSGYSWFKWQEAVETGYESETLDKSGSIVESRKKKRDQLIQEGRLSAEEFDAAVSVTNPGFYASMKKDLADSMAAFSFLDAAIDMKFGKDAPRISELGKAIEDCSQLVEKLGKGKGLSAQPPAKESKSDTRAKPVDDTSLNSGTCDGPDISSQPTLTTTIQIPNALIDADHREQSLWAQAIEMTINEGAKKALELLLDASLSAPSVRSQYRIKLLLARLSLKAQRHDLARPILEQLNSQIDTLKLEQWESPVWIGEVLGTLYQCLMSGEPAEEDITRAKTIFHKLCTIDVTKAIAYCSDK